MQGDSYSEINDFLISLISNSPMGIITVNLNGDITIMNKYAKDSLGIREEIKDIIEQQMLDFIDDIPAFYAEMKNCLTIDRQPFDLNLVKLDNKILIIKGRPILKGMIITIEDITHIKKLEAEVLSSVLKGQEDERRRLAQEIHDGIGPVLSTVKMNLENSHKEIKFSCEKSEKQYLESIKMLDNVTSDLRAVSHDLLPSVLEDYGLKEGLESYCERISEAGKIKVNFYSTLSSDRLKSKLELGLYRIVQELVSNAIKYSNCSVIMVQLIRHEDSLVLMVEDNGQGFDKQKKTKGIGLVNMKTRTHTLGGTFVLDTVPGRGVSVIIEIPLKY